MTAAEKVKNKALSLVGQGYIYGAKGQVCTPGFRQGQAAQYPEQAATILETGGKWDGWPVWDCAQLTRAAAAAGGVTLVSGATSQWKKTAWQRFGAIDTLPRNETAFVFRAQAGSEGKMAHTGVALGDGMCVHAAGTQRGVVHEPVEAGEWTHWAAPAWPVPLYEAQVHAAQGSTVNLRKSPGGAVVCRVPVGEEAVVWAQRDGWCEVDAFGEHGYMQQAFVRMLPARDSTAADASAQADDVQALRGDLRALEARVLALERRPGEGG